MGYFANIELCSYFTNAFITDLANLPVRTGDKEQLIDIEIDETARMKYKERSL